jgi:hypothetical protein
MLNFKINPQHFSTKLKGFFRSRPEKVRSLRPDLSGNPFFWERSEAEIPKKRLGTERSGDTQKKIGNGGRKQAP